jgi:hypothetical protein
MAHCVRNLRWWSTFGGCFIAGLVVIGAATRVSAAEPEVKRTVTLKPVTNAAAIRESDIKAESAAALKAVAARRAAEATAQQVDQLLTSELFPSGSDRAAKVGGATSDEVFLRRIYLDLIGRNPSAAEVTAFALDPSDDKRAKFVDRLLGDEQFGSNWGRYWRDVIMYRRTDERAQLAGPAMTEYLTTELNKNTPWDAIARAFITATGDVRENGATGLMMAQDGDTANIASEVSRIFTGVQIQCAQCHDHKTDRWKREQFHELAAFFPRVTVRPQQEPRTFHIVGVNFERQQRRGNQRPGGKMEHFMPDLEDPSAKGTRMNPVFFATGQKLDAGKSDTDRRETIARWITAPKNEWFAKAFVNRIWAEMVGEGFYEPIDDLGPDKDCTAPQTMNLLAKSFVDSKYDIKQLYRTIAATSAYQRESRTRRNAEETAFACNCPQRLRGDQLYSALASVLGFGEQVFSGGGRYALLRSPRNQFNQVFGYDPSDPRDDVVGTIPQALLLMNGTMINAMISANRRTELGKLLASTSDDEAVAVDLYLRCVGREPNKAELQTCLAHVKNTKDRAKGFEDVLWALVNSTEFLHRK